VRAQGHIDSLKNLLPHKDEQVHKKILLTLAAATASNNVDSALAFAEAAISHKPFNKEYFVVANRIKGQLLILKERAQDAITVLNVAKALNRDPVVARELYKINNCLATSYLHLGQPQTAFQILYETYGMFSKFPNDEEYRITLSNIGFAHYKASNYDRALEYYQKASLAARKVSNNYQEVRRLSNLILCLVHLGRYDEGEAYLDTIRSQYALTITPRDSIQLQYSVATLRLKMGGVRQAIQAFEACLALASRFKDYRFQAESLLSLAQLSRISGKPSTSLSYLALAEKLCIKEGFDQVLLNVYQEYIYLFENGKVYGSLVTVQEKYILLKRKLYSITLASDIGGFEAQQMDNAYRKQIDILKRLNTLKSKELDAQKRLSEYQTVLVALVLIAVFLLGYSLIQSTLINARLAAIVKQRGVLKINSIFMESGLSRFFVDASNADTPKQ
jgi:tetratricopeptide (TPR) repeat protein